MFSKLQQLSRSETPIGPKKRVKAEEKTYAQLRAETVPLFAQAVKMMWMVKEGPYIGLLQCFTCLRWFSKEEIQCGHYQSVKYEATQFLFNNARPQCEWCNCGKYGEAEIFRERLVEEIGEEAVLWMEAERYKIHRQDKWKLIERIQELKDFLSNKNTIMEIRHKKFGIYFIRFDGLNWCVYTEKTTQEKDIAGKDTKNAGKTYESTEAYCSSKPGAYRWIAAHRFANTPGVYDADEADKLEAEILEEVMSVESESA